MAGPTSPKGSDDKSRDDKSKRPGLDAPPPPPPGGGTVNMSVLAGQPGAAPQAPAGGTPPTGDMAGMVVQRAALLDQQIQQLAQMLPAFVPMAAQMSMLLKQGIVQSLQMAQGGGGPAGGAGPTPQGAMAPPPPGPGAGAPAPMPMAGLAG